MNKENIYLKIITYFPIFFIPLLVGVVSYVFISSYNNSLKNNLADIEKNLYALEKQKVQTAVLNMANMISYRQSITKKALLNRVKRRVVEANVIAQTIYEKNVNVKSDREIKQSVKNALTSLEWNGGESFIWIVDCEGVFQLAPTYLKRLEGSSIINLQDATGRYVIQEEIAICKEKGEGFIWDTFTKPNEGTNVQYEQVAFVKSFGRYGWYFGSAEYLDTATKNANADILESIRNVNSTSSNYTFVTHMNGEIVLNRSMPQNVGVNISKIDDKATKKISDLIIGSVLEKESASITYDWLNPATSKIETKYTFIKKIPNSQWIIGSGFYLSSINSQLFKQKVDMYDVMYEKSTNILYVAFFIMLISLIFAYYITSRLKKSFIAYKKSINVQKDELQELNETLELKVKNRTLALEKMTDDFKELATIDTLTKISNRYSLMKLFHKEINRSQRYDNPLSILMIDIDYFKKVNDTYGHDVGDGVLVALAKLMKNSLREVDTIGRYGGEEFLMLLPDTQLKDAQNFAQRLLEKIATHHFKVVESVTISVGLIELAERESMDEAFKRVDKLLYKSKKEGRNRVSF